MRSVSLFLIGSRLHRINILGWPNRNNLQRRSDNHKHCTYYRADSNLLRLHELRCKDWQIETNKNANACERDCGY